MALYLTDKTFVNEGQYCSSNGIDNYLTDCCFTRYTARKTAIKHQNRCYRPIPWREGLNVITKEQAKYKRGKFIDNIGKVSRDIQDIDYVQTSVEGVKMFNLTVFVYVIRDKPVGLLTTDLTKNRCKYPLILDFMVIPNKQRQGIGKQMFDAVMDHCKITPDNCAYSDPNYKTCSFLHKWYKMDGYQPW